MELNKNSSRKNKPAFLENRQEWVTGNRFDWLAFLSITLVILLAFILF